MSVNVFALLTYFVAIIGWVVAFAGSVASTQRLHSYYPRFSWWALAFQILLLIILPIHVASHSIHSHRLFLVCCLAIAFVYNSNSANNFIYYSYSSTIAGSAGFIICSVVNLIWLYYLGSDPSSSVILFLDSIGHSENVILHSRRLGDTGLEDRDEEDEEGGDGESSSSENTSVNDEYVSKTRPVSGNNPFEQTGGYSRELNGFENPSQNVETSQVSTHHSTHRTTGLGVSQGSGFHEVKSRRTSASTRYSVVPDNDYPVLVRGLYNYHANPDDINELSFNKGEVFKVKDTTGNWWQGKNGRGEIGMCPSNYVEVLTV